MSRNCLGKSQKSGGLTAKRTGAAKPAKNPQKIRPFYQCKSLPIIKLGVGNGENRVFERERAIFQFSLGSGRVLPACAGRTFWDTDQEMPSRNSVAKCRHPVLSHCGFAHRRRPGLRAICGGDCSLSAHFKLLDVWRVLVRSSERSSSLAITVTY
jgi:hypothetical protein